MLAVRELPPQAFDIDEQVHWWRQRLDLLPDPVVELPDPCILPLPRDHKLSM